MKETQHIYICIYIQMYIYMYIYIHIYTGHSNVGDKSSIGDRVTTKVAITVGVGKYNGGKMIILVLEIFNSNDQEHHIC